MPLRDLDHIPFKDSKSVFKENANPLTGHLRGFWLFLLVLMAAVTAAILMTIWGAEVFAQTRLPGADATDKLEAAGTLLRLIDTGLFKWGARVFAGLCIMSAAWSLKEQRFGMAIISIIGAIIFGTAPTWVRNIFAIGGSDSVFSFIDTTLRGFFYA